MPPALIQPTLVPPASFPAGGPQVVQSGGKSGEGFVAEIHDRYYQQVISGNMFFGTAPAAALTIPIFSATAQVFGLWNPLGSGKNAVLAAIDLDFIVAPIVLSGYAMATVNGLGSQAATAGPVTAFTAGTPRNCLIGGGTQSVMNFIPSTLGLTTAPLIQNTFVLGISVTSVTAAYQVAVAHYDFQGRIVLAPGSAAFLTAVIAETSSSCVPTLWWYEQPL